MKIIVQLTLLIIILHKTIAAFTNDINFNASIKTAQILIKKGQTEEALSIYLDLNENQWFLVCGTPEPHFHILVPLPNSTTSLLNLL